MYPRASSRSLLESRLQLLVLALARFHRALSPHIDLEFVAKVGVTDFMMVCTLAWTAQSRLVPRPSPFPAPIRSS